MVSYAIVKQLQLLTTCVLPSGLILENEFFCIKNLSVNKSENLHAALRDDNRHSSRG
jgi:hypothetical protein